MTRHLVVVGMIATVCLAGWVAGESAAPSKGTAPVTASPPSAVPAGAPAPATGGSPAAAASSIERRVTGLVVTVPPGLPAALQVALKNTGPKAVEVAEEGFRIVTVEKEGSEARAEPAETARQFWVWLPPPIKRQAVLLDPGRTVTRTVLLVVGRPRGDPKAALEWLFPQPGRYRVRTGGVDAESPILVTVAPSEAAADRAAGDLWTLQAAAALAGEGWPVRALLPLADKIVAAAPNGPYAAYALWLKADFLARHAADIREMNLAAYLCDAILERHPDMAAQDEVFEALFTVCGAGGQATRARDAAADLAAAFPQSLSLARVRQAGGDAARVSAAPAAGAGIPVTISGLDQVQRGPREVLDAYWRSAAKGRLLAVSGVLARDFMGGFGTRVEQLEHLSGLVVRAAGGEIRVAVRKAAMADAYDRPVSLPNGEERSWRGHICIIEGTVSVPGAADRSGRAAAAEPIKASWALLESPAGTWKLISETRSDRNLSAGVLGRKLLYDLNMGFPTWHLSDGRRDRFPYEEVKRQAGVAGKVVDERTEWDSHTLVMAGPARDQMVLTGQVRMLLKADAGVAARGTWVARSVQVTLVVDDRGVLVLKDLTVSAAVEQPHMGPESDRPPPPRRPSIK